MTANDGHNTGLTVRVAVLEHGLGLDLPSYQTDGAAGLDLLAAVPEGKPVVLSPGARILVPTGLAIAVEEGFEAQIRPRSGLALKHGISVLNSPGTIDSDYRGEVGVILINHGDCDFEIGRGDRIAQMVFHTVVRARLDLVVSLDETGRGAGGFGSTGGTIPSKP